MVHLCVPAGLPLLFVKHSINCCQLSFLCNVNYIEAEDQKTECNKKWFVFKIFIKLVIICSFYWIIRLPSSIKLSILTLSIQTQKFKKLFGHRQVLKPSERGKHSGHIGMSKSIHKPVRCLVVENSLCVWEVLGSIPSRVKLKISNWQLELHCQMLDI